MTGHPTPAEIAAARQAAGLTQTQAAALIGISLRTWQNYESHSIAARRKMPLPSWKLFCMLTNPERKST